MSSLFKFFCGNCVFSENFPKASFSTNISMKNDYKLPISSMQSLNFRFNILLANNKEVIILKKSIFRILALITQSFYNKKGLLETNKKRSSVFINKSKNSLNINNLLQSKKKKTKGNNELIQGLDIQILMKMEKDFFSNEKVLQKFIEGFEKSNLIIFYSNSFLTMILKRLVFSLNKINFINLLKIFEKCDFGIEACLRKDLQTTCSNKSECLLWNAKQIININCEITFLDLLEYKGFQNGKFRCLEPENIRELIEFITSILEKSNICVIFIPNDSYIEDFVEIFDEVLINTEIQR